MITNNPRVNAILANRSQYSVTDFSMAKRHQIHEWIIYTIMYVYLLDYLIFLIFKIALHVLLLNAEKTRFVNVFFNGVK